MRTNGYTVQIQNIADRLCRELQQNKLIPNSFFEEIKTHLDDKVYSLLRAPKPKIMVYGIYNSGKSTLVNAILKEEAALTGDHPITDKIKEYDAGKYILVDSPGVDAPIKHEQIADAQLEKCHIILFVMSSNGEFENITNYKKMVSLIEKSIPFYIVLNERSVRSSKNPQEKKRIETQHQEELTQIKEKIIENLIKISRDKKIGEKYSVIVVNAKRAWAGIQKEKPVLVEKSNIDVLLRRIDGILEESNALEPLQASISALDACIGQAESDIYSLLGNKDYAADRKELHDKRIDIINDITLQIQSIVLGKREIAYRRLLLNKNWNTVLNSIGQEIMQDIQSACKETLQPLEECIKTKFSGLKVQMNPAMNIDSTASYSYTSPASNDSLDDLEIQPEIFEQESSPAINEDDSSFSIAPLASSMLPTKKAVSPIEIAPIIGYLVKKILDNERERERREYEEFMRLSQEIESKNREIERKIFEEAQHRQEALSEVTAYLDRLASTLKTQIRGIIDKKILEITHVLDNKELKTKQTNQNIQNTLNVLQGLRKEISQLREENP